ncbi:tetratricopeptide repeat protein [Flammeovirgaceae bacterium SG7u.111]|nr:tetratricopeptide repeat protein [Flammeovirgaceae bacterium SG7u.132]WPO34283.1 tetratricopeptide repeat protein [Flammeovirgaceae bacterium SG7u.111]
MQEKNCFQLSLITWVRLLSVVLLFSGCQAYHDTTARFNAYFLAKEKMLEIENTLFGEPVNDYNDILQVLVTIDTNHTRSQKTGFDYVIEKASLPIQWHETSEWVDDCYILIGTSRLYQGDFMNATLTYKFVNTYSKDADTRHEALVKLMRTYIEAREYDNMFATLDFIRKEKVPFSEDNTRDYHIVMAHYYRLIEDYPLVVEHLERAMPLIQKKKDKAHYYYLLGQIYEMFGDDEKAFLNYDAVMKHNPDFELAFQADLNRSGVKKLETEDDVIKASKYYRKLLSDENNWEYRDKIYYEMAIFEIKRNEHNSAINYLSESAQVSSSNTVQKSYSYLKMGEIYYDHFKDFENAALYYDSTMQVMPKDIKVYEEVKEKAEVLKEFVKYLNMVRDQDRLINYSNMEPAELDSVLTAEVTKEKEKILQTRENRELAAQKRVQPTSAESSEVEVEGGWYFYNSSAVVFGRTNFVRIWGTRPLEDNWRLVSKSSSLIQQLPQQQQNTAKKKKGEEEQEDIFASVQTVDQRKAQIPNSDEAMEAVKEKLAEGLFGLGKTYYYKLKELENTLTTFNRMADEFPYHENTPEAIYIMYLLCTDYDSCDANPYKNKLVEEYPKSFYARIIVNPNYVEESNVINEKVANMYKHSYELYKADEFEQADSLLSLAVTQYPENNLLDKIALLKVMILGKTTDNITEYYIKLDKFMKTYTESELVAYAKTLMSGLSEKERQMGASAVEQQSINEQEEGGQTPPDDGGGDEKK